MAAKKDRISVRPPRIRQYYCAMRERADAPPIVRQGLTFDNRISTRPRPTTFAAAAAVISRKDENVISNQEYCHHCHSTALRVDWKQGDRVCTNCGVVAEEHLLDDGPEWRDFNEAEDLAKGLPAAARCGLVPVDETKYIGGLQPTTLSKQPFGGVVGGTAINGADGYKLSSIRARLIATDRKLNRMTEKMHRRALEEAKLDLSIQQKRLRERTLLSNGNEHADDEIDDDDESSVRPEYDHLILQEEEDAHRMHAALHTNKWSLSRAILLHGTADEQEQLGENVCEEKYFLEKMDNSLKAAAKDLYNAYSMISHAARCLNLPEKVLNETIHRLLRYASRRDGFLVKGVSSRISSSPLSLSPHDDGSGYGTNATSSDTNTRDQTAEKRNAAIRRLREHNKLKQMGSLGSAILFLTARNLGWTRSLVEVCASFQVAGNNGDGDEFVDMADFIKPKHVFRAMNEIKTTFPDYAHSMAMNDAGYVEAHPMTQQESAMSQAGLNAGQPSRNMKDSAEALANFVDHSLRRLQLPPVAEASIRTLFAHCRSEQIQMGQHSGTKLSTLCAAVTYFVCTAGAVMQKLAQQAKTRSIASPQYLNMTVASTSRSQLKRARGGPSTTLEIPLAKKKAKTEPASCGPTNVTATACNEDDSDVRPYSVEDEPFDVFKHPVVEDQSEKQYEMRRMWDAWAEQMPWLRKLAEVEESCGVSRTVVMEFYRSNLYPRRKFLLGILKDSVSKEKTSVDPLYSLRDAPFASMLLDNISTAAPLMTAKGNQ